MSEETKKLIKDIQLDIDNGVYTKFERLGNKLKVILKKINKGSNLNDVDNQILKDNQYV